MKRPDHSTWVECNGVTDIPRAADPAAVAACEDVVVRGGWVGLCSLAPASSHRLTMGATPLSPETEGRQLKIRHPSKLFFLFVVVLVYGVTFDQVLKAFEIWVQQYYYE